MNFNMRDTAICCMVDNFVTGKLDFPAGVYCFFLKK